MWEYHVEEHRIIEKWGSKRQAAEVEKFRTKLNELGQQNWEMIGFNSIPLVGGISGNVKGYAYLTFFKRST